MKTTPHKTSNNNKRKLRPVNNIPCHPENSEFVPEGAYSDGTG